MLPRVLEVEAMDTAEEAAEYDAMDHSAVNRAFAADFLAHFTDGEVLDVGTGTALIPIELCRQHPTIRLVAVDLAEHMLARARTNVAQFGLGARVSVQQGNGRGLAYPDGAFTAVVSNSIVHHIPEPFDLLAEIWRVVAPGGLVFLRDLARPADRATPDHLVETHAVGATARQRQLFADSLHAALTLAEIRTLIARLGADPAAVSLTSDRHWTWAARKAGP